MTDKPDYKKNKKRNMWVAINTLSLIVAIAGGFWLGRFWGVLAGAAVLFLLCVWLGFLVYKETFRRNKPKVDIPFCAKEDLPADAPSWWLRARENMEMFDPQDVEDVYITSDDGLKLHGLFIRGTPGETRTAIVLHYYHGLGMSMGACAACYRSNYGFNILLADARGHGGSEGKYFGMGWHDRCDYLQWIDYVIDRVGPETEILLHGVSMGASTVMMLCGEELPSQVRFAVEDCGYSGIAQLARYQMRYLRHYPLFPLYPMASLVCRVLAGFWFGEASCLEQVKKTKLPMIFVHGEADTFVPFSMVYDLYEAAACPEKKLITIPGAAHTECLEKDEKNLIRKAMGEYIAKYMAREGEEEKEFYQCPWPYK